jgi:tetratricopeptide (TPR) repeat protein
MAALESFYTVRAQRFSSADLRLQVAVFEQRGDTATSRATEIEYHMARGDEQYYKRHYFEALKEYKLALGLIYQLVEPSFNPTVAVGPEFQFPLTAALFEPFAATVLTVVDRSPDTVPVVTVTPPSPIDPLISPAMVALRNLGSRTVAIGTGGPPEVARDLQLAAEHARARQFDLSIPLYLTALDRLQGRGDARLVADVRQNLGVAYGETGQFDQALGQFNQAGRGYSQLGDAVAEAAVQENVSALHARAGRYGEAQQSLQNASALYGRAAGGPPPTPGAASAPAGQRSFTPHDLNNATIRIAQQQNGLQAIAARSSVFGRVASTFRRAIQTQPVSTPAFTLRPLSAPTDGAVISSRDGTGAGTADARVLRVVTGLSAVQGVLQPSVVELNLSDPNRVATLRQQVYQARVGALTLEQLGVGLGATVLPDNFWTRIPQHYFFTIQVCLGDTYLALGRFPESLEHYAAARNYQFLNTAIEAPNIWIRTARCLLTWGRDLYRKNQIADAADRFQQIVAVAEDGTLSVPPVSPLYNQPPFAALQPALQNFIATMDDPAPAALNAEMAILIRQARTYQDMIHAGLNFLGLPLQLIPIFRFRYLQAVARYFAEQAIKAERDFINFRSNSEQETAALMQLQQAEDLAVQTVELERRRVEEAVAEEDLASAAVTAASNRVANATQRRDDYVDVSADRVALDTATAHASGGFTETEGGYQVNLGTSGERVNLGTRDYEIMRSAAWHRGMIMRQFELDDMQRTIDEYTDNLAIANAQATLAARRKSIADQNKLIADLRLQQAKENREFAESKTFNAELWSNLADRMRDLSQLYLDRAIEIALLMQAAYNFESDTSLNKIGVQYTPSEDLGGLLGGDSLLADINYFTYHEITQSQSKEIPAKTILSLAERYPFSLFELRRTGVANFETKLEDFDRLYPGSYMHKLHAIEVTVEGLIGADGWSGCLKNSGTSSYRTRDNAVKTRLQPAETLFLSSYSVKGDAVVFRPSEETLGVFEGSGVATAWTLDIPRGSNDLNYEAISDVKLVLYYHGYYDPGLEAVVRAALPATGSRSRSFSLRFNAPDAFFLMLDRAETDFTIGRGDFPFNQVDQTIQRISLYALTENGISPAGVQLTFANEGAAHTATVTTGADGTVSSDTADPAAALNVFVGDSPLDVWSIALDRAVNPELFHEDAPGVFRVTGIRDIVVGLDYDFAFRV